MATISDNFLIFQLATDPTVIGHYPQAQPAPGFNHMAADSIGGVRVNSFPEFNPSYESSLHKDARPSDFIIDRAIPFGWLVSPRVKLLLSKASLPPHRFYPIQVHHQQKILNYFWFHFIFSMWEFLVPDQSELIIQNIASGQTISKHSPKNDQDLFAIERQHGVSNTLRWSKITLLEEVLKYDVITIDALITRTLISKSLKNTLHAHSVQGFETSATRAIHITTQ